MNKQLVVGVSLTLISSLCYAIQTAIIIIWHVSDSDGWNFNHTVSSAAQQKSRIKYRAGKNIGKEYALLAASRF